MQIIIHILKSNKAIEGGCGRDAEQALRHRRLQRAGAAEHGGGV